MECRELDGFLALINGLSRSRTNLGSQENVKMSLRKARRELFEKGIMVNSFIMLFLKMLFFLHFLLFNLKRPSSFFV